MISPKEINGLK